MAVAAVWAAKAAEVAATAGEDSRQVSVCRRRRRVVDHACRAAMDKGPMALARPLVAPRLEHEPCLAFFGVEALPRLSELASWTQAQRVQDGLDHLLGHLGERWHG